MAQKNKKGTAYLGLGLEEDEEKKFKKLLKEIDKSAAQVFRTFVRKVLKGEITI